jgi:hypothetical protein
VKSQHLQLEILESSALGDIDAISDVIENCQTKLGINVALDDFGTGYSSLTHIRNLSANVIKIDRSFVRDLLIDPNDYSIIEGIIGLANAFNHKIIAEGVETDEQGLMLLIMNCDEAQGYSISRPLPAEELVNWLASYKPNSYWLSYSKQSLSAKQKKLTLLQLTTKHWYTNTLSLIEAGTSGTRLAECHLGVWFNHLKYEKLFTKEWLKQLKQQHDNMYTLASELIERTNTEDASIDPKTLSKFKDAYRELEELLQVQAKQSSISRSDTTAVA